MGRFELTFVFDFGSIPSLLLLLGNEREKEHSLMQGPVRHPHAQENRHNCQEDENDIIHTNKHTHWQLLCFQTSTLLCFQTSTLLCFRTSTSLCSQTNNSLLYRQKHPLSIIDVHLAQVMEVRQHQRDEHALHQHSAVLHRHQCAVVLVDFLRRALSLHITTMLLSLRSPWRWLQKRADTTASPVRTAVPHDTPSGR